MTSTATSTVAPARPEPRVRRAGPIVLVLVLVLVLCGTAMSLMQTLVVPLLPNLQGLLHTSADNTSWLG